MKKKYSVFFKVNNVGMRLKTYYFSFLLILSLVSCASTSELENNIYLPEETEMEDISFITEVPNHSIQLVELYENSVKASWEIYCPVFEDADLDILEEECMKYTKNKALSFKKEIQTVISERDEEFLSHFIYFQDCNVNFYESYVNVFFENYCFSGGAHGNTYYKTFTFDTFKGEFCDIFDITGMKKEEICQYCRSILLSKLESKSEIGEYYYSMYYDWIIMGTEPSNVTFLNYIFYQDEEERGVEIVFEPYSVAPYSKGVQVVRLPLEKKC